MEIHRHSEEKMSNASSSVYVDNFFHGLKQARRRGKVLLAAFDVDSTPVGFRLAVV